MKNQEYTSLSIRLIDYEVLKELAQQEGRTYANMNRMIIEDYVEKHPLK